jgi:diaminopimelate epimerase
MIPVKTKKSQEKKIIEDNIFISGLKFKIYVLKVGGPHTVIFIDNINDVDIVSFGEKIENHEIFPQKTNVNFVKINNKNRIELYTWERGSGRTLACGTGACASVVVGFKKKLLDNKVSVYTNGGQLDVEIKDNENIYLTGGVHTVFKGVIDYY